MTINNDNKSAAEQAVPKQLVKIGVDPWIATPHLDQVAVPQKPPKSGTDPSVSCGHTVVKSRCTAKKNTPKKPKQKPMQCPKKPKLRGSVLKDPKAGACTCRAEVQIRVQTMHYHMEHEEVGTHSFMPYTYDEEKAATCV